MKFTTKFIILLLFIVNSFAEEAKENEDHKIIHSYYKHHNDWEFEKLLNLFHKDFILNTCNQLKIKPEDFKTTMIFYFKKKMNLQYKSKKDFKEKNTYKIEDITLDYEEDGSKVYIVTSSGKTNGVNNHGKMIYVIKDQLIITVGSYEAYQNLQIEHQVEQEKP